MGPFSLADMPLQTMDTAGRVVTEDAPNVFPFGLVFDDQMFGLSIVAAGRLEDCREEYTGPTARPDSTVLFHLLNRGLWDQQAVDAPQEASSRAIRYSAVMGERLWGHIATNTAHVSPLAVEVS